MKKRYVLLGILILYGFLFVFPNTIVGEQRYVVLLQGESTSISGYISEDTTWTVAGSPYIIVGGVIVNPGAILTIESGVVVRFTAGTNLVIDGGLIAQGNATNRIMFTSNATAPAPGDWAGILIRSSGFCNVASSVIKYATCGINFDHPETSAFTQSRVTSNVVGIEIFGHRVRLEGLTIENNTDCGIYGNTGYIPIRNSMISKNNIGIKGNGASANINNCTISNNTLDGIYSGWIMHIDGIWDSHIVNNGGWGINIGARLRNCRDTTISNNSGGGVYVYNYWSAEIYSCNITNNNGHGVFSSGEWGGGVTITGSIISNNRNYGVLALGGSVNVESSTIIDNGNVGVSSNWGRIHFCDLYNNSLHEVKSSGSRNIDATYNWWGTTNETLIRERIHDYFDDTSLGVVNHVPFLNSSKATLTISTNGVPSEEPVGVKRDGIEVGLIHDEGPLNMMVYSGHTQPNFGTFTLSIDNARTCNSNPSTRHKFVNWTGPAGIGTSDAIILTVTANSSITAFYKTQYSTNFNFKDNSGTDALYVNPSEIHLIAPDSSSIVFTSFLNQWLDEGTWTIRQIDWQNNNVNPSIDLTHTPTPGGAWTINCRVYPIYFSNSFKDNEESNLDTLPSSFKLTFPNGTTSAPLNPNISYYIQNGTTTWSSIIWRGTDVSPSSVSFDPTIGNPTVNCEVYSLTIDPVFYDTTGTTLVQPSSWSIEFPNGTATTVSSLVMYSQIQGGNYSIVSIIWNGAEVVPAITPNTSLASSILWSPSINCLLPTSLSVTLSSSTSYVGFRIQIEGNLTCNEVGLSEIPLLLSYSVTGGETWNDITLINTTSDGSFSAVWMPSATGSYLVSATWSGDSIYPGSITTVNLAVIPFEEQSVFSVASNSTVSELAFNSTSRELSFTVTGPSGTAGYVNVYIAKALIDNIADVKASLDGVQLNYTATSMDDSWLLHLTYLHSTHKVTVNLGDISFPFIETPLGKVAIYVVPITAIAVLIALWISRKKR